LQEANIATSAFLPPGPFNADQIDFQKILDEISGHRNRTHLTTDTSHPATAP